MRRRAAAVASASFDWDAPCDEIQSPQLQLDAHPPEIPEVLSPNTRVSVIDLDDVRPTVQAGGVGDAGQNAFIESGRALDPNKPPYRVPLMSEIAAFEKNNLVVVSTFSGCGGSCLGFKMAGYRVLWANEFIPAAQETYRANHPDTHLDVSDIRSVTPESIRAVIGDVEIDVLEGSPPCASFSTAGKGSKGWGQVRNYSDTKQRTDDLFTQYVRLLDGLRPRAFVAENVAGIVKGASKGHFKEYLELFRGLPYNVEARLLDAQHLGVPQRRVRLIFIGVRKDVGRPAWPKKLPYTYSVRDAIPWISGVRDCYGAFTKAGAGNSTLEKKALSVHEDDPMPTVHAALPGQFDGTPSVIYHHPGFDAQAPRDIIDEPCPTVKVGVNGLCSTHFLVGGDGPGDADTRVSRKGLDAHARIVEPESALGKAVGAEWDKLRPGEQSEKYMSLILPTEGEPCRTVTALGGTSAASVAHPYERRKFTIAELRRICGFPDDFILTGTYAKQWERLGRAVPPPMMRAVAEALLPVLLPKKETL